MAKRSFTLPGGKGVYVHKEKASARWESLRQQAATSLVEYVVAPNLKMSAPQERWVNRAYCVFVSRFHANNFIDGGPFARIGIMRHDQAAVHDFRDYQHIKNDVCGDSWEAIELYPSESRLVDPSNFFILWAFPPNVLKIGMAERNVLDLGAADSPQRPFSQEESMRKREPA